MESISGTEAVRVLTEQIAGIGVQAPAKPVEKMLKPGKSPRAVQTPLREPGTKAQTRVRTPAGPPGGVLPMIGFIVAFNALAFVALAVLMPKAEDGLRHAIWDPETTIQARAWWPDVAALLAGHVMGFIAWAVYVYRLHKRERLALAESAAQKSNVRAPKAES
jgi:hypothetical protein